jgi:hypothetical protein
MRSTAAALASPIVASAVAPDYGAGMAKKSRATRDESVRVRCSDAEREAFQAAAEASGLDMSSWLRMIGRSAAAAAGHPVVDIKPRKS